MEFTYQLCVVLSVWTVLPSVWCVSTYPKLRGAIKTEHAGFVALALNASEPRPQAKWNILVSRFNGVPFSTDYVSLVVSPGLHMDQLDKLPVYDLSSSLHWPNEVKPIPEDVFGRGNMVMAPTGFLVPTKGSGELAIFDLNNGASPGPYTPFTADSETDWFYHRVIWTDMNGDGKKDAVTCRAHKPLFGATKGQLLWYEQPDFVNPWTKGWQPEILYEGDGAPDVFLIDVDINVGNQTIQTIITAGYFSQTLDIWWRTGEDKPWRFDYINKRVIDSSEGAAFDLLYADLNADGQKELLVTYNKMTNGSMFVYELPSDFRTGTFGKHLIYDGFNSAYKMVGKGAPGSFQLSWPTVSNQTGAPDILLSGDDSGYLYLLRSNPGAKWSYNATVILDEFPGTVGEIDTGDLDGDGYTDIVVPCYNSGEIKVLSYPPSP